MGQGHPLPPAKEDIRRATLRARAALSAAQRSHATARILATLRALPAVDTARTLAAYAAFGDEVCLDPWLVERIEAGIGVFLPYVDGPTLSIVRVRDLDADTTPGYRRVREPSPERRRPARVDRIEAFVVPGAAFDPAGHRLGYGGGHFDRLLANASPEAVIVGVAFDVQLVPAIPAEPHDIAMDAVVTESRTIRCTRALDGRLPPSRGTT